jgi:hypothetical protein
MSAVDHDFVLTWREVAAFVIVGALAIGWPLMWMLRRRDDDFDE